ncbi:MAG: glycosyl hydrolase [Chloroherpetonaceae bacterium]|nr:glycosyl hydrolase [Chthonomonadaceae bacterium]MDW8207738.1 glycosyl hydrolase [Chloroherpetonaceae bacterium]
MRSITVWYLAMAVLHALAATQHVRAQPAPLEGGQSVLPPNALRSTAVYGLERTNAQAETVPVNHRAFRNALRVTIRKRSEESNATQLTIDTIAPVEKGDVLLASLYLRGRSLDGKSPARITLLFERNRDPWTKSVMQDLYAPKDPDAWRRVWVPFTAVETYRPGEAMVSLRFAFDPQIVEVGPLAVWNYGKGRTMEELRAFCARQDPLGMARVTVQTTRTRQTLEGFGGNFCQPRYGATEPMDAVGEYNLKHLQVVCARIGLPLEKWAPAPGVYRDEGPAHAAFLQMRLMKQRGLPLIVSVWEGPQWMLGGQPEQMGRTLPAQKYADCIEAIAQFLVTARDRYNASADYFSFNEPDYGVNFEFTPEQMVAFIRQAGARFAQLGLKTRFLTADTATGGNCVEYARVLLQAADIQAYLGPIAFHCWDALAVPEAAYEEIGKLGKRYNRAIWCTEAGHDAQLWQAPDPWGSWDNALRTATAYAKTLQHSRATLMLYWTYQDNYPLVSRSGQPYPVHHVIRQMEEALPAGAQVVEASCDNGNLRILAAKHPKSRRIAVLLVNPMGPGEVQITGLPANAPVSVRVSDAERQRRALPGRKTDARGQLTVTLPARSVVTAIVGANTGT